MMMPPPQVVGVLLKKPGQQTHPRLPPLDPQETKIKGKFLYSSNFFLIFIFCIHICKSIKILKAYKQNYE